MNFESHPIIPGSIKRMKWGEIILAFKDYEKVNEFTQPSCPQGKADTLTYE